MKGACIYLAIALSLALLRYWWLKVKPTPCWLGWHLWLYPGLGHSYRWCERCGKEEWGH